MSCRIYITIGESIVWKLCRKNRTSDMHACEIKIHDVIIWTLCNSDKSEDKVSRGYRDVLFYNESNVRIEHHNQFHSNAF